MPSFAYKNFNGLFTREVITEKLSELLTSLFENVIVFCLRKSKFYNDRTAKLKQKIEDLDDIIKDKASRNEDIDKEADEVNKKRHLRQKFIENTKSLKELLTMLQNQFAARRFGEFMTTLNNVKNTNNYNNVTNLFDYKIIILGLIEAASIREATLNEIANRPDYKIAPTDNLQKIGEYSRKPDYSVDSKSDAPIKITIDTTLETEALAKVNDFKDHIKNSTDQNKKKNFNFMDANVGFTEMEAKNTKDSRSSDVSGMINVADTKFSVATAEGTFKFLESILGKGAGANKSYDVNQVNNSTRWVNYLKTSGASLADIMLVVMMFLRFGKNMISVLGANRFVNDQTTLVKIVSIYNRVGVMTKDFRYRFIPINFPSLCFKLHILFLEKSVIRPDEAYRYFGSWLSTEARDHMSKDFVIYMSTLNWVISEYFTIDNPIILLSALDSFADGLKDTPANKDDIKNVNQAIRKIMEKIIYSKENKLEEGYKGLDNLTLKYILKARAKAGNNILIEEINLGTDIQNIERSIQEKDAELKGIDKNKATSYLKGVSERNNRAKITRLNNRRNRRGKT
jgi:hypothetical protein